MKTYRATGVIRLESTGEEAEYDVDVEADSKPSELEVLDWLMKTGDIQIISTGIERVKA